MNRVSSSVFYPAYGLVVLVLFVASGCGLRYQTLPTDKVTPMTEANVPIHTHNDGKKVVVFEPSLTGTTCTFDYDRLLWYVCKLPCVRTSRNDLLMLDTGLGGVLRATLPFLERYEYPTRFHEEFGFAYGTLLAFGTIEIRDFPIEVEPGQWQFHLLGIPLYRLNGIVLDIDTLRRTSYLLFDNPGMKVTIGFEPFVPSDNLAWSSYDFVYDQWNRPVVRIPINGVVIDILADTGGGPEIIFSKEDWEKIADHVEIVHQSKSTYPAWRKANTVQAYQLKNVTFGDTLFSKLNLRVVQDAAKGEGTTLLGLGLFADALMVWDFHANRLWVGEKKK